MSEKAIIFSTPEVQATLDGRKTQSRLVIKPQPKCCGADLAHTHEPEPSDFFLSAEMKRLRCRRCGTDPQYRRKISNIAHYWKPPCQPGDILWVRETFLPYKETFYYKADGKHFELEKLGIQFKWSRSIIMPRAAARIFLQVTDVKGERLRAVSEGDAMAEGCTNTISPMISLADDNENRHTAMEDYARLWDSLNAKHGYGWDMNPYVWVIEFEKVGSL